MAAVDVQVVYLGDPIKLASDGSAEAIQLGLPATIDRVRCDVSDDAHPRIGASFEFQVWTHENGDRGISLQAVRVGPPHAEHIFSGKPLSISMVRDLPLARWEQAARGTLAGNLSRAPGPPKDERLYDGPTWGEMVDARTRDANELVYLAYPELIGDDSPAGQRRFRSLRRLVLVAGDYMHMLIEGRSDPAAEIAREYNVSPSTARSWIHRARKAGFLAPAVGRTAGVAADQDEMRAKAIRSALEQIDRALEGTDVVRVRDPKAEG